MYNKLKDTPKKFDSISISYLYHITIGVLKMQRITWKDNGPQLMKYYTNKLKKTKFPDHFVIDGKQITDQKAI